MRLDAKLKTCPPRPLRCDDKGNVTFQYRHAKTGKLAQRTLPGADFLWHVLQHVLPKGLRRSRNFGFLHPNSAGSIRLRQVLHLRVTPGGQTAAMPERPAWRCAVSGKPPEFLLTRPARASRNVWGCRRTAPSTAWA